MQPTRTVATDSEAIVELVVDTPQVVVLIPVLRRNIERMASDAMASGVALRPHAKTHKMVEIARLQLEAGASGIQVAKTSEALALLPAGPSDILVGFPILGTPKLDRLLAIAEAVDVAVAVDSVEVARAISDAARRRHALIRVVLEIDTGLGRVGVDPAMAVDTAAGIAAQPGVDLVGVMTHEGHAYGASSRRELEGIARDASLSVVAAADAIREAGHHIETVSVGSSATAKTSMNVPGVTEVRPGTYVFNDLTQVRLGAATLDDIALVVVATVVSCPTPGRAVIDAGTKTFSSDRQVGATGVGDFGSVVGHPDWRVIRASEEHGVLEFPSGSGPSIGDRLMLIPNHACAVVNLHDSIFAVDADLSVHQWQVVARGAVH